MDCSVLPLEILLNGLTHCYYAALYCRRWGDVRAAIKEAPIRFQPCPVYHRDRATLVAGGIER